MILVSAIFTLEAQDVTLQKIQREDKVVVVAENRSDKAQLVTLDVTLENVITDRKLPIELVMKPGEKKELVILSPVPLKAWSYKTKFSFGEYVLEAENEPVASNRPLIPNNEPRVGNTTSRSDTGFKSDAGDYTDIAAAKNASSGTGEAKLVSDTNEVMSKVSSGIAVATSKAPDAKPQIDYYVLPPENTDDAPMPAVYAYDMRRNDGHSTDKQVPESSLLLFGQAGCPRCAMVRSYLTEHRIPFKELSITGNKKNQERMNQYLFDEGFEGGQFMMPVLIVDGETHYSIEDLQVFLDGLGADN